MEAPAGGAAGPVLVTIAVPALITATLGTGTVALPRPLAWLLTGLGVGLGVAGVVMLAWTTGLFDRVGKGTLAPFDPPRRLVVRGPYQHVRNPMFTGVLAILLGEAAAARSLALLAWFALFFVLVAVGVPLREEPRLARTFGADYTRYLQHVPRWLPRLRPWPPSTSPPSSHQRP